MHSMPKHACIHAISGPLFFASAIHLRDEVDRLVNPRCMRAQARAQLLHVKSSGHVLLCVSDNEWPVSRRRFNESLRCIERVLWWVASNSSFIISSLSFSSALVIAIWYGLLPACSSLPNPNMGCNKWTGRCEFHSLWRSREMIVTSVICGLQRQSNEDKLRSNKAL